MKVHAASTRPVTPPAVAAAVKEGNEAATKPRGGKQPDNSGKQPDNSGKQPDNSGKECERRRREEAGDEGPP
eukprot:gene11306-19992_t